MAAKPSRRRIIIYAAQLGLMAELRKDHKKTTKRPQRVFVVTIRTAGE
jgi:hypothetical protein